MKNGSRAVLKLSLTPESVKKPYLFSETNIKVYTYEELIYHMYHYFGRSMEDFLGNKLNEWLTSELKIDYIASQLNKIKNSKESLVNMYIAFLGITDYFEPEEISDLKQKLTIWERRSQWEKLKEKGDGYLRQNEYKKAENCYIQALRLIDEPLLYNNLAVAYMYQEKYLDAEVNFQEALLRDGENLEIIYNIIELYIIVNRFTFAEKMLEKVAVLSPSNPKNFYYWGELESKRGKKSEAIQFYMKALENGGNAKCYYRLTDVYIGQRKYDEARLLLENVPTKGDVDYYLQLAKIYVEQGLLPYAKNNIESALKINQNSVSSWLNLARVSRKMGDVQAALGAITKASELSPKSADILFETALIKKDMGRIKDYQTILEEILYSWKQEYREG